MKSRATLAAYIFLLIAIIEGALLIFLNSPQTPDERSPTAIDAPIVKQSSMDTLLEKNAELRREVHRLERELEKKNVETRKLEAIAEKTSVNWQEALLVQESGIRFLPLKAIKTDGRINKEVATLFELSDDERVTLESSLQRSLESLNALAAINVDVQRQDEASCELSFPIFLEAGDGVREQLVADFSTVLGPERFQAFMTLTRNEIDRFFQEFGAQERNVTIIRMDGEDGSPPTYIVEDTNFRQGSRQTSSSEHIGRETLLEQIPTLKGSLPPDF